MNNLTEKLLGEGYTKENHPDYVRWYDSTKEFEYTPEYLCKTVWEAPCGIQRKGYFTHGYMSYAGVEWRVENDNYNFHCPYRKKECEYFHPLLKDLPTGSKCVWHMTDEQFSYNNSAEKIEDEKQKVINKNLEKRFGYPGMIHCACCHINEETLEPYFKFEPEHCIRFTKNGCDNETCWCTGKQRDLTLGNIYYDVKVTTEYCKGFIIEPVVRIKKGVKLFSERKTMADLDMYLKVYPNAPLQKENSKSEHSRQLFYAKYHGQKYELEIQNVRIEKRESRDLMQDLQDIRDGIEVVHASDLEKAKKQIKRERREKRQKAKKQRTEKNFIANLKRLAIEGINDKGEPVSSNIKEWAKKQLSERGIITETEYKQVSLFD